TLQTAWKIDRFNDYKAVRTDISAVKAMMQKVLHDVSARALQIHGSLGTSHEMPFVQYLTESFVLGLADGPTEVHKVTLARLLLKDVQPAPDTFPSEHILRLREAAEKKFADTLAGIPRGCPARPQTLGLLCGQSSFPPRKVRRWQRPAFGRSRLPRC